MQKTTQATTRNEKFQTRQKNCIQETDENKKNNSNARAVLWGVFIHSERKILLAWVRLSIHSAHSIEGRFEVRGKSPQTKAIGRPPGIPSRRPTLLHPPAHHHQGLLQYCVRKSDGEQSFLAGTVQQAQCPNSQVSTFGAKEMKRIKSK